jgi:hypothetical protein
MTEIGEQLISTVDQAERRLERFTASETGEPVLPGGWSRKQVLGHLIDSASNNHQRFVRAGLQPSLDFPGYDQQGCVHFEAPEQVDWSLLVALWASYNRYLAHVIGRIPDSKRDTSCRIGSGQPVTLAFLAVDYLRHMRHHLRQIGVADAE